MLNLTLLYSTIRLVGLSVKMEKQGLALKWGGGCGIVYLMKMREKQVKKVIKIGKKLVGEGQGVFVVAEAGVNHNGQLDLALKLVDVAADCGADAIKFQAFRAEQVVAAGAEMAQYQKDNLKSDQSQYEMLKALELKEEWYLPIIKRCQEKNIIFLSAAQGSFSSVDLLQKLDVSAFKFGSGDLTNLPVLEYAAQFKKPIILGTGMANMEEVKTAVRTIRKAGNDKIIALHATTNYPCSFNEVNLRAMQTMMKKLDCLVGYSDHTLGIEVSVMASILGSTMVEKHFTLDKSMEGPDHKASANPEELKEMIKQIRNIETILGNEAKQPQKSELIMKRNIRKSLVAEIDIKKGEKFNKENLSIKRPGYGITPKEYYKVIGKAAKKDIKKDSLIKLGDF